MSLAACAGTSRRVSRATTGPYAMLSPRPWYTDPSAARPVGPRLLDSSDVYAADRPRELARVVRHDRPLIYVPNSASNTVDEINPRTYKIVRQFSVGAVPQHVVPSYDLRTLWVTNDAGNSLTPINARTGKPGHAVPVADPYNMYFTPDGRYAVVMAESLRRIDFLDAHTMKVHHDLRVPACYGVNHADFSANGAYMLVSCEYTAAMIVVDVAHERLVKLLRMPPHSSPQDVKLAPNGKLFYVADLNRGGVWEINARTFHVRGFINTGAGAHGLYPSRNARDLYVSNRARRNRLGDQLQAPRGWSRHGASRGGSPDMGGVSANGRVLWLSGRYDAQVYAISTRTGRLLRRIPVGFAPHGVCVWPQPGRFSLGHTGVMR